MQSTALVALSEYLRSLQRGDGDMQYLPVKQLLVIVTDLMAACESVHVKEKVEIGYFDYVKQYFYKKHPAHYDKYLGQLLRSLLKHSKPNTELSFYSTLMSSNVDSQILVPISKAVSLLKKKLALGVVSEGRSDDLCRKVKLSYAEVVENCKKIFTKFSPFSAKEYEDLTGKNIKHRVRDYILKIQSHSTILESNGLTFLEIILREAALVRDELDQMQQDLNEEGEDIEHEIDPLVSAGKLSSGNPSPMKDSFGARYSSNKTPELKPTSSRQEALSSNDKRRHQSSDKKKPLYDFNKVMGEELPKMSPCEIKSIKQMHVEDARFFAQPQPGNNAEFNLFTTEGDDQYQVPADVTFDDIYANKILNKREDRVCLNVVRDCQTIESKIKQLRSEIDAIPKIDEAVEHHKHNVVNTIHQRKAMAKFMNASLIKMDQKQDFNVDDDLIDQTGELFMFYELFSKDINKLLGLMSVVDRHSLTEYMDQSDPRNLDSRMSYRRNSLNIDFVPEVSEIKQEEQSPFIHHPSENVETPEKVGKGGKSSIDSPISRLMLGEQDPNSYLKDVSRYIIKLDESSAKKQYDSQQEFEYHEKAVQLMIEDEWKNKEEDSIEGDELRPIKKTNIFSGKKLQSIQASPINSKMNSTIKDSKIKIKESSTDHLISKPLVHSQVHYSSIKASPKPRKSHLLPDVPEFPKGLDRSLFENMIYDGKRRKMHIVNQECRLINKNCVSLRIGDVVCSVKEVDGWSFVYFEENPKKYGFFPTRFLALIS